MRYITRIDGQKRVFRNKAAYDEFMSKLERPVRERKRTSAGVTLKARHVRHGTPLQSKRKWRTNINRPHVPCPKGHIRQRFSIIHPSRGRPWQADGCAHLWCSMFSTYNDIEYILSLDSDDVLNYLPMIAKTAGDYPLTVSINDNRSVVDAMNNGAKVSTGDVLIYVSDDFLCPPNWDLEIQNRTKGRAGRPWVLEVSDGTSWNTDRTQTILILSRQYYDVWGYLYYPEYFSVFGDNDFTECSRKLGTSIRAWDLVFKHDHPTLGGRPADATLAKENSSSAYKSGKAVYTRRKKENFGITPDIIQRVDSFTQKPKRKARRSVEKPEKAVA